MARVAVSILNADFSNLAGEVRRVEKAADMLHLDVMDGHFVGNITIGIPVIASLRKVTGLFFDVHLMIERPERYIEQFAAAGADSITIHAEAVHNLSSAVEQIRRWNVGAAVALSPKSPLSLVEPLLARLDMVLLMTVNPGFGKQKFIEDVLPKISGLRRKIDSGHFRAEIEVDGGINEETARLAVDAGADILVAGSFIYTSANPHDAIKKLNSIRK